MAVIIDELQSNVTDTERGVGAPSTPSQEQPGPKALTADRLAADLERMARRKERLRAD